MFFSSLNGNIVVAIRAVREHRPQGCSDLADKIVHCFSHLTQHASTLQSLADTGGWTVAFGINSTLVKGRWCQQTVEASRETMASIIIHYYAVRSSVIVKVACITSFTC